MQLFLPYPTDLKRSAQFLDDKRLDKQIKEAVRLVDSVFSHLQHPKLKISWKNHPAVLFVYNNGRPKIPFMKKYISALLEEFNKRGFRKSPTFLKQTEKLFIEFDKKYRNIYCREDICSFQGDGLPVLENGYSHKVGNMYRQLLFSKYPKDKVPPKCTLYNINL